MKKLILLFVIIIALISMNSCTEKLPEADYFKIGYEQYNGEKYQEAIENFEAIMEYYPEGSFAPKALFMMGYIYSNHLKDLENAKKYYQEFVEKYPDHELAKSAEYELATLGKDIDELDIFKKADSLQATETTEKKAQ